MLKEVVVPDIGDYTNVNVIDVLVKAGQRVAVDDSLLTLETDKATVEIPSPFEGVIQNFQIKVGDKVSQGDKICEIEVVGATGESQVTSPSAATSAIEKVLVPDIGDYKDVNVIEVMVSPGQAIEKDHSLITLETDKATVEIPSPYKGVVQDINVQVGDKVSQGSDILTMQAEHSESGSVAMTQAPVTEQTSRVSDQGGGIGKPAGKKGIVYAGPGVRRFAREMSVDLREVGGSGRKHRIMKNDVKRYVSDRISGSSLSTGNEGGFSVEPWPKVDFSKFGPVTSEPLSRIKKLSGSYLHRNWVMVPHVTQFDEADITDMEAFRQKTKAKAQQEGYKLTPLLFVMKAVVRALKEFPLFNASLDSEKSELILKQYFHLGIAVDTPNGLVVPVIRDVDKKGFAELGKELGEISGRAREGKLSGAELQGSSFSISSLGGVGGTAFTPIVNVPDVAILGVSKAQVKPVMDKEAWVPRLHLPLSLSYDHRVIDGAEAARFITFLTKQFENPEQLLA